ncbi:MAG: AMP-binding protein [Verrucomicrobiota bacterium]
MNPSSSLFDFSRFGDAPAFIDRASGRVMSYSELEFSDAIFPQIVTTRDRSTFDHALHLISALRAGRIVAPISFRLPETEAKRRIDRLAKLQHVGPGTILFTSGSSGDARAIWHPLDAHIANARGAAELMPLQPGDGWLLSLPLHHVSGFSILIRCLLSGAAVVFPDPALPLERQISDPAVTHVSVVSTQLLQLLENGSDLSRLRAVLAGGGPFPESLIDHSIQSGAPIHLTYGMTETASQITTTRRLTQTSSPPHCGLPLPGREVRISNEGMIEVRGPVVSPDLVDSEGWFSTGDLGRFDDDANLVILGRRDRMFISGGENIQPEPIEGLLTQIPGVRRAVVVPRKDARFGERPVAFVSGDFDPADLKNRLAAKLESFAIPDLFLSWPEEIPDDVPKLDFALFKRLAAGL